jgi:hypothetical protein
MVGKNLEKLHLRTRDGYSLLQQAEVTNENDSASMAEPEPK